MTRSLAKKSNNFEDVDKDYAYGVWLIEKEFNVGKVTGKFPLMKFWNLLDKENVERYKRDSEGKSGGDGIIGTIGS